MSTKYRIYTNRIKHFFTRAYIWRFHLSSLQQDIYYVKVGV